MADQENGHAYKITWVTDQLAVGCAPMSHAQLQSLKEQGIDGIINLCGEFCDLHEIEQNAGFEVYYLPIEDEEAPGLLELENALEWLDESIYLGKKVLIHCRHGIGRTGTVLNAYLLRRGLGHKLAGKKMKELRSKPANFSQWWTIRKYGRKSGKLTARTPTVEFTRKVDLSPFFNDYLKLVSEVEQRAGELENRQQCGLDHDLCCRTPLSMTLAEALHLSHCVNLELSHGERVEVIEKAMATARIEKRAMRELAADNEAGFCLSGVDSPCPLLEEGRCRLFEFRPLQCRAFGLDSSENGRLWREVLSPGLDSVSTQIWFACTGAMQGDSLPRFSLPDVVSGKFIEVLFKLMMEQGIDDA
ncbi:dual specificity protein phosphatase family protein [Desulfovibrio sp. JC010]|uniref:phosphatase domain-containing putative toxin n=1 Tax=Desulfovibrio sp. JC010 TaxID=2593641 RepID=UPI0013D64065|nr:dual specificity protein phosphatase family protein [Desulfovibrio sp. JC010]NDV26834.1 phosphatase [Desulfovibrio sp. JC010]